MLNANLTQAVESFAGLIFPLTEKDLEREWKWKDHDEEGIRFACFVTLQELRHLAVTLFALRSQPNHAHRILSQYHAAYVDLQAAILGLSDEDAEKIPSEGEWQVRKVYSHILGADFGFTATIRYALELHRANKWTMERIPESEYPRLYAISESDYDNLMDGPLSKMVAYHRDFHTRIIQEFSNITDSELELPSTMWEETRFPIQHRLHRYEAHFVQHTIQIDKTLVAIGQTPGESKRLIRKIYAALAEAEGLMIGAEKMDETAILATASSITERTKEIEELLK
jgi:DinB family protein